MALDDQLVEVVALLGAQAAQAEVIQDDQVRGQVAAEDLLIGPVRARLAELGQQSVGADEDDRVAGAHAGRAQALGQQRFAHADRSDEHDVLLAGQKLQREDVLELAAIDVHR